MLSNHNPYRLGTKAYDTWERAKREGFDITEEQIDFVLGLDREDYHLAPTRIAHYAVD